MKLNAMPILKLRKYLGARNKEGPRRPRGGPRMKQARLNALGAEGVQQSRSRTEGTGLSVGQGARAWELGIGKQAMKGAWKLYPLTLESGSKARCLPWATRGKRVTQERFKHPAESGRGGPIHTANIRGNSPEKWAKITATTTHTKGLKLETLVETNTKF